MLPSKMTRAAGEKHESLKAESDVTKKFASFRRTLFCHVKDKSPLDNMTSV